MGKLAGETDPEKKRKIIGAEFVEVFQAESKKLTNAKWATIGKCSADTALRDINDLLARGVLRRLEGGGRNTAYGLVK